MKNIVILISGDGSNMKAIVHAAQNENWPAHIAAVISNRTDSKGILFAHQHGINTLIISNENFLSKKDFEIALKNAVDSFSPHVLVLAGFMKILTSEFIQHYKNIILNIHPSLLPAFPGLKTHQQALKAGVKLHGATVHFVTQNLDSGPIIAQVVVPVLQNDTEDTLRRRVLQKEHLIYPKVIRLFIEDKIKLNNNLVYIN